MSEHPEPAAEISAKSETTPSSQTTKEKILSQATEALKEAEEAQAAALQAYKRADEIDDPEEKKKTLEEAAKHDKKAKSAIKSAQRLQSGVWQGGASGAGIGAGIGAGVGTVVGSIVGGVAAIPTTGVGLLVGMGTGAIHGPWVKLGEERQKGGKKDEGKGEGSGNEG